MRTLRITLFSLWVISFLSFLQEAGASSVVSDSVSFVSDGTPASGVRVTFFDLTDLNWAFSGMTDEDGRFRISCDAGHPGGPASRRPSGSSRTSRTRSIPQRPSSMNFSPHPTFA